MRRLSRVLALPILGLMACVAGGDAIAPPPPAANTPVVATVAAAALPSPVRMNLTPEERAKAAEIDPSTLRDPFERPKDAAGPTPGEPAIEAALRERNATVPFGETAVGDLVVRGTARGARDGYAIIADGAGKSEVVHVGSRIGRARVQGREIIDWRVDRVKDGEVVLVEESFSNTSAAPTTMTLKSS